MVPGILPLHPQALCLRSLCLSPLPSFVHRPPFIPARICSPARSHVLPWVQKTSSHGGRVCCVRFTSKLPQTRTWPARQWGEEDCEKSNPLVTTILGCGGASQPLTPGSSALSCLSCVCRKVASSPLTVCHFGKNDPEQGGWLV